VPAGPEPAAATVEQDLSEQREAPAAAVNGLPQSASDADMIRRGQKLLSRARSWFSTRPAWAKILLVLLLIGLLPWLLIAAGLEPDGDPLANMGSRQA
jgi:hypothetical protein